MQITNLTTTEYDLPGLRVPASGSATLLDARYEADEYLRATINTLVTNGKVSVSGGPLGFPLLTALEREIASGEVPGGAATPGGSQTHVAVVNRQGANVEVGFNEQLPFDHVVYDPDGLWVANDLQFVPKIAGYYRLTAWGNPSILTIVGADWSTEMRAEANGNPFDAGINAFAAAPGTGYDGEIDGLTAIFHLAVGVPTDLIVRSDGTSTFLQGSGCAFELVAAT